MLPLTLLAAQKFADLLRLNDALAQTVATLAQTAGIFVPQLNTSQVVLTSANREIGDREIQFAYPRVVLYSSQIRNLQREKFRSFSGGIAVVAEIWSTSNLVQESDQWIHYYVEALTSILRNNIGDWGDGFIFSGIYDVQLQPPKLGGLGYLELAKLTLSLDVSLR
jgi:hypothetical protein